MYVWIGFAILRLAKGTAVGGLSRSILVEKFSWLLELGNYLDEVILLRIESNFNGDIVKKQKKFDVACRIRTYAPERIA